MGCFTTVLMLAIGIIYLSADLRPMMDIQGFWFAVIAVWVVYFISWLLIGDIADEISGVNKYKDDEY